MSDNVEYSPTTGHEQPNEDRLFMFFAGGYRGKR